MPSLPTHSFDGISHNPLWAANLVHHLKDLGVAPRTLIEEAGFPPGEEIDFSEPVPFRWIAKFFELAADAAQDPLLGFRFGMNLDSRDAGLLGFLGAYASTLENGLSNVAKYSQVFGDAMVLDVDGLTATGRFSFDYHLPPSIADRQYLEWFASGCVKNCRQIMKRPIFLRGVQFRHPRRIGVPEISRYFGCDVIFGADENVLFFEHSDLGAVIPSADGKLEAFLRDSAEDTLGRHVANVPPLQEKLEKVLMSRLSSGAFNQETIARELGMSVRTLSRRLAQDGLTYQSVSDGIKEALATQYLIQSSLSQLEIAFLLGFNDQSSFGNAYKRWTGNSPGKVRSQAFSLT